MKIRELLTDESKWIRGSFARNNDGDRVDYDSKDAVCWCLSGAVCKCYPNEDDLTSVMERIKEIIFHDGNVNGYIIPPSNRSVMEWNDDYKRKFEEVRRLVETLDI